MGGSHELKFGFGYRKFNVTSTTHWGGNQLFGYIAGGTGYVHVARDAKNATQAGYWSGYAGDTFTKDRHDPERWACARTGRRARTCLRRCPPTRRFPEILGADRLRRQRASRSSGTTSRRGPGVTFALDESRKTVAARLLRALRQPAPSGQASVPGPRAVARGLLRLPLERQQRRRLRPAERGADRPRRPVLQLRQPQRPERAQPEPSRPPTTRRSTTTSSSSGSSVSSRPTSRSASPTPIAGPDGCHARWAPRTGFTAADYTTATFTQQRVHRRRLHPEHRQGAGERRLPDARQPSRLPPRLPRLRGVPDQAAVQPLDGPRGLHLQQPAGVHRRAGGHRQPQPDRHRRRRELLGALRARRSTVAPTRPAPAAPARATAFINAKWQLIANALVQLPAGFEFSGALLRTAGPSAADRPAARASASRAPSGCSPSPDARQPARLPTSGTWTSGSAKNFRLGRHHRSCFTADLFNVFNANTELSRFRQASSAPYDKETGTGSFNRLDEILNPRVLRLGVRFQF